MALQQVRNISEQPACGEPLQQSAQAGTAEHRRLVLKRKAQVKWGDFTEQKEQAACMGHPTQTKGSVNLPCWRSQPGPAAAAAQAPASQAVPPCLQHPWFLSPNVSILTLLCEPL